MIEWGPNIQFRAAVSPVVVGAGSYLGPRALWSDWEHTEKLWLDWKQSDSERGSNIINQYNKLI